MITTQDESILVINIYNPPATFLGFDALESLLRTLPISLLNLPTVLVTDSNLHSSLWNPTAYPVHDPAADTLVETMLRWNLFLRSPKGVPTYEAKVGMKTGVTIDLVWVNQQANDLLVAFLVDSEAKLDHHSDHHAVVTILRTSQGDKAESQPTQATSKSWHKVDQPKFLMELKAHIVPLSPITSSTNIDSLDSHIIEILTQALNAASPNKSSTHRHKAWWNPTILGPLKRAADKARKRAKLLQSEGARAIYFSARNTYFHAIEHEKTISWRRYLSTLTVDTLVQAKRYASGPRQLKLVSTLIDGDGTPCISNNEKASALFKATCVATAPCDLQDIPPRLSPRVNNQKAT